MDVTAIKKMIETTLPGASVEVVDLQGSGDHFEVTVVAEQFEGRSLLERHRMVYGALGDAMRNEIHALMIKALTPEQHRAGLVQTIGRS